MNEQDLGARAAELLRTCAYANVATESEGQPWNTPVLAVSDKDLNIYWSSWHQATHSRNISHNPRAFLTLYDSTRARGTNNLRCLYLLCETQTVADEDEAAKAHQLVYPGEEIVLADFFEPGLKRFYRATPQRAWLNCLSERELTPATLKMRVEVSLEQIRLQHGNSFKR